MRAWVAIALVAGCGGVDDPVTVARFDAATGDMVWSRTIPHERFEMAHTAFGQLDVAGVSVCGGGGYPDQRTWEGLELDSGASAVARGADVRDVLGEDAVAIDADAVELVLSDAATGESRWTAEFPCAPQPEGGICTEDSVDATLAGDLVLVSYNPLSSSEAVVEGWSRDSGSPLWSRTFTGARRASAVRLQTGALSPLLVKIDGNGGPERVIAVDASTGDDVWGYDLVSEWGIGFAFPIFEPALVGDVVVFSECTGEAGEVGCGVVALDVETGAERWRFAVQVGDRTAVAGGGIFTIDGGDLVALEPATATAAGEERWRVSIDDSEHFLPVADDVHVYVVLSDGTLAAFDSATGDIAWESALPDAIEGRLQLLISGESVHVVGEADLSGRCSD